MVDLLQLNLLVLTLGTVCVVLSSCDEITPKPFRVSKEACLNGANDKAVKNICCLYVEVVDAAMEECTEAKSLYETAVKKHEQILYFSRFVVCVYDKRKLIRSDTQLDMRQVKADAKFQYPNADQSEGRHFMVDMYKDCSQQATKRLNYTNSSPKRKASFDGAEKPFFMFVYRCVVKYSQTKCPPYIWNAPHEVIAQLCHNWAEDCKKLLAEE